MESGTKMPTPYPPSQPPMPQSTFGRSGPPYQQAADPLSYQRPSAMDPLLQPTQNPTPNIIYIQQPPVKGSFREKNKIVLSLAFIILTVLFIATISSLMRNM